MPTRIISLVAAWKASTKNEALVSFEMTSGGSDYRVFAFPVFAPGTLAIGLPASKIGLSAGTE